MQYLLLTHFIFVNNKLTFTELTNTNKERNKNDKS